MANYGLKIAKNNGNVKTDSDPSLVFSSLFTTLPLFAEKLIDTVGNSGDLPTLTIKHGLNFVPVFMVFYKSNKLPTYWQWAPDGGASFLLGTASTIFSLRADKENIIVRLNFNNGLTETITIKVLIFNFPIAVSI